MKQYIHQHITSELSQNTKTDTIFILTSILLNLITLGINSALAQSWDSTIGIVMVIFSVLILVVNSVAIFGILKGKQTRTKLLRGLIKMYEDENVDQYYDSTLLANYNTRYNLFLTVVVVTGLISISVPFILV